MFQLLTYYRENHSPSAAEAKLSAATRIQQEIINLAYDLREVRRITKNNNETLICHSNFDEAIGFWIPCLSADHQAHDSFQTARECRVGMNTAVHINAVNTALPKPFAQMVSHLIPMSILHDVTTMFKATSSAEPKTILQG